MATYEEIIREEMRKLPREISWWPSYLYHFTDIHHAVGIIDKGWIYDRATAEQHHLTRTDAASHNVLEVTSDAIKHCGRLYMRPLTPTQFYSEGYKPEVVRNRDYKDVNCPVPVFFLLDAARTLAYPGVYFVEKGAAGRQIHRQNRGIEEFASLQFDKIFHHGSAGYTSDIGQHRRTEVLRDGGIPLNGLLRRIVCRSAAEEKTLLSLLKTQNPARFEEYRRLIVTATPDVGAFMFNGHGIYIKTVKALDNKVQVEFNEATLRYDQNRIRKGGVPVTFSAEIYWKDDNGQIICRDPYRGEIDYKIHNRVNITYRNKYSDQYQLEIRMDDYLVFQGDFGLSDHDLII